MNITYGEKIRIEYPSPAIVEYCEKELTIKNPEYEKKKRLGFSTWRIPKKISLYERVGDTLLLPFGCLKKVREIAGRYTQFHNNIPKYFKVFAGENPVALYDYQQRAVGTITKEQYGILQAPAGSGKTQMGIAAACDIGYRTLWLTHTVDLLNQSYERAKRYIPKELLGKITAGKVDIGKLITFATVQTMSKLNLPQYREMFGTIIVDECHRVAGTPTAVTMFSKVLNSLAAERRYGLSATVHRSDGMLIATKSILGDVIYEVPQSDVQDTTMQVGIKKVFTGAELSEDCLDTDGTIIYSRFINTLCCDEERNKVIVEEIIKNKDRPSLILSDRLEHLAMLRSMLPFEDARIISGKMTSKKGKEGRQQIIEDMRTGKIKYLFATYALAKEGLDIPCLERLYLVTPQKDYAVITQAIGRIARVCDDKSDPICIDFVDNIGISVGMFKKRMRIYKKNNCYLVTED